ncbi:MAG: hypothetical protein RLN70_01605, partial [Rhodospirillaceae bacterium]
GAVHLNRHYPTRNTSDLFDADVSDPEKSAVNQPTIRSATLHWQCEPALGYSKPFTFGGSAHRRPAEFKVQAMQTLLSPHANSSANDA